MEYQAALFYSKLERLEESGDIEQAHLQKEEGLLRGLFSTHRPGQGILAGVDFDPVRKARDIRQIFLGKLIIARRFGQAQALDLIQKQRQICQGWYDHLVSDLPVVNAQAMDDLLSIPIAFIAIVPVCIGWITWKVKSVTTPWKVPCLRKNKILPCSPSFQGILHA
jgi:hypothetical protein